MKSKLLIFISLLLTSLSFSQSKYEVDSLIIKYWSTSKFDSCLVLYEKFSDTFFSPEEKSAMYPILLLKNNKIDKACLELEKGIYLSNNSINELENYKNVVKGEYPDFRDYKTLPCQKDILIKIDNEIKKIELNNQNFIDSLIWETPEDEQKKWNLNKLRKNIKKHKNEFYFIYYDSIPILVRLPKNFNPKLKYNLITYLQGGVNHSNDFMIGPIVLNEPIFRKTNSNSVVVYPFSKKSIGGWQDKSILNKVDDISKSIIKRFKIQVNNKKLIGFSNGATGVFIKASNKNNFWDSFIAINPVPEVEETTIKNIGKNNNNLISIHSNFDEETKSYKDFKSNYHLNNWNAYFVDIEHGFIYSNNKVNSFFDFLVNYIK